MVHAFLISHLGDMVNELEKPTTRLTPTAARADDEAEREDIARALGTALLEELPDHLRPESNIDDMRSIWLVDRV
jgi:hypothetical protein